MQAPQPATNQQSNNHRNNNQRQQNRRGGPNNRRRYDQQPKEFDEKVVQVNRVSKKTKGGNKIGFSVLVVVGDKKGRVGVGLGKGPDVLSSIKKAIRRAKKHLITIPMSKGTIPFETHIKRGAAKLLLKPAPEGTGVIAGGAVRAVVEAAGIRNIVAKILGSSNKASNVYATFAALKQIRQIAYLKDIKLEDKPAPKKVTPDSKNKTQPKKEATTKTTNADSKAKATKSAKTTKETNQKSNKKSITETQKKKKAQKKN